MSFKTFHAEKLTFRIISEFRQTLYDKITTISITSV